MREAYFKGYYKEAPKFDNQSQKRIAQQFIAKPMTVKLLAELCEQILGSDIFDYEMFEGTLIF